MTRLWRDYNYMLFGSMVVLTGFGLAMIYSTTHADPLTYGYFSRHLVNLIVGSAAMLLLTSLDYHALQAWARAIYIVTVAVLAVVLVLGKIRSGAQSWLDLGLRTFQPSEPAKLLIIITLAGYWARFEDASSSWPVQFGGLALASVPLLLVFVQPDFGTALVFATVWLMMAWTAGLRLSQIAVLTIMATPIVIYGWTHILEPYQQARLLIFIDPQRFDPELKNGAWNIMQSLAAVGSGGLTGRGWMHGVFSQGHYLPVQYSDFIFAVTAEELGFVGTSLLVLFETVLIWQAIVVANVARDRFGRLVAVGIAALFMCHVLINVGMNMSIMPITGIPLPFISYGGSFTLTTMAAIGLLQSVALRRWRIVF